MKALIRYTVLIACISVLTGNAADIPTELPPSTVPKVPVPKSPYIGFVYKYADTMVAKGRDTYGPQKTGLFLSALDRKALAPLTNQPVAPGDVGPRVAAGDSALAGANAQHDENLLRLLYTLSELSAKPAYRDAADAELKWLLQNKSPLQNDPLLFEAWDTTNDNTLADGAFFRPWLLWDRCFDIEPAASATLAGRFGGRDAQMAVGGTPRFAGFAIRALAAAYARTKDEWFLTTISSILDNIEASRKTADTGKQGAPMVKASDAAMLSFAIDCDGAAHRVSDPLASRLRAIATREDTAFSRLPNELKSKGGFPGIDQNPTPMWTSRATRLGQYTTAQVGMMCVSRYENSGHTGMRDLMHAAADAYLKSNPADADDVWPSTLGHVISLELAAWRSTSKQVYFERARELGDLALEKFFGDNPLPRASLKSDHYESITGGDSLVLALLELHLSVLHITAVRCPSNTIDR